MKLYGNCMDHVLEMLGGGAAAEAANVSRPMLHYGP